MKKVKLLIPLVMVLLLTFFGWNNLKNDSTLIYNSALFIESSMATSIEGEYKEKEFLFTDFRFRFISEKDKKNIAAITRSLVDNEYYEFGNTLYKLELSFFKKSLKVKVIPIYDDTILKNLELNVFEPISDDDFIELVEKYIETNYFYKNIGFVYKPLHDFIEDKKGQCYNFSEYFYLIAKKRGLDVRIKTNDYHAWNEVLIDGTWKVVDLTLIAKGVEYKIE
jgi:hypothetical protein